MTTSARPYCVTVRWERNANIASWSGLTPDGQWCTIVYTLKEIEMVTGERPFPPRGLRRVVGKLLRPLWPARVPSLPGPWANRDSTVVQARIERWGRHAGAEWARAHAWTHHQRVLGEADIVFECFVNSPRRPPAEGQDLR